MREKPEILKIETIAETRIFRIEQVGLRFSNGNQVEYERVRGSAHGSVLIVPMLDDDTVLLIREYAVGVDRYELTLPKGLIEKAESPLDAANREIMEEVGYASRSLEQLTTFTLAPGYLGSTTHIVLAQDLYPQRCEGDEPEEIEVVPWSLRRLDALLEDNACSEARTIAALYMVRDRLSAKERI
ncbi:ADP compounds hydrolase NudE [Sulfuriflexus mobilis]|uniref:ADP compounds hydrolase NudE n=1 Tax=Sulfuriflexus mobilis TaxID=1811807 RepID=UPI000F840DDD|nr:ADP compounds hydrolase NudE [Sulfuriflexus mobilis]